MQEFTFRIEDLLNLVGKNINAKNIIVKVDPESKRQFTARVQPPAPKAEGSEDDPPEEIVGCPYPPGCTP
ncbi:MAG: hypothetical protein V4450_07515 [Bacteroidota bacterium]